MCKPNGEEPMTKQEEIRRRAAVAERARKVTGSDSLRTAFYSALFGASSQQDAGIGAAFEQAR
jgi:hypothetical protein